MNTIDVLIVAALGLGIFFGWSRGVIQPLLAEAGFLLTAAFLLTHPGALNGHVPQGVSTPVALLAVTLGGGFLAGIVAGVVARIAHRLPLVRQLDAGLGIVLHTLVAFVLVYLALSFLAVLNNVFTPLGDLDRIGPAAITALQGQVASNPALGTVVSQRTLEQLKLQAAAQPLQASALGDLGQMATFYDESVRPELARSRLAPLILDVGSHLPLIGHSVVLPHSAAQSTEAPS
jgi:hypothetical protein